MGILKESIEFYKKRKLEEKQKKTLLSHKMDFQLLEELIQKANENPDLRIDIHLADGTKIYMKTYYKKEVHDMINGNYIEVE